MTAITVFFTRAKLWHNCIDLSGSVHDKDRKLRIHPSMLQAEDLHLQNCPTGTDN